MTPAEREALRLSVFAEELTSQTVLDGVNTLAAEANHLERENIALRAPKDTDTIDRLFLELSQFTHARTAREIALEAVVTAARTEHEGICPRRPQPDKGFLGACNICARLADLDAGRT